MNILMLCYYYPPLLDVGSKRSVAFSKYFRNHGWKPYVISVRNPDKHYCTLGREAAPEGVVVEYTLAVCNVYNLFGKLHAALTLLFKCIGVKITRNYLIDLCIPDIFFGWIPLTLIQAVKSIKEKDIDVIYVSCSPFSSAIIGVLLKNITNKFLVIDFRDPLGLDELTEIFDTPAWKVKINKIIEGYIIKKTDIFIVNNEEVKSLYKKQYHAIENKIHALPNGFDFEFRVNERTSKYEKFTIIYAGLFYFFDKRNSIHTYSLFKGLSILKESGEIDNSNFQFLYYGVEKRKIEELTKTYNIEDLFICHERKPYAEVLDNIKRSHLQLLRISKPMISTKLFEGIALDIPFLATIPDGEVKEIVNKYSPNSYVISEKNPEQLAQAILSARNKYNEGNKMINRVQEFEQVYSRENLTIELMKLIKRHIIQE